MVGIAVGAIFAIAAIAFLPRMILKIRLALIQRRLQKIKGQLFDEKAEKYYESKAKKDREKIDEKCREATIDEITDYFAK